MRIKAFNQSPFHSLPYIVGSATAAVLPFYRATVDFLPDGLQAIIATGDLQGVVHAESDPWRNRLLGEALASELRLLQSRGTLPAKEHTAVFLTGDLQPSADVADVRDVWYALGDICRWVAGVAGNHDGFGPAGRVSAEVPASLNRSGLHFLDGQTVRLGAIVVGGLSGIICDAGGPWTRPKREFVAALSRLAAGRPDVLLSHDGPNVLGTSLSGWPVVRRALESAPPTLLLRGHDAWRTPFATLVNGSQVLNVEGIVVVIGCDGRSPESGT